MAIEGDPTNLMFVRAIMPEEIAAFTLGLTKDRDPNDNNRVSDKAVDTVLQAIDSFVDSIPSMHLPRAKATDRLDDISIVQVSLIDPLKYDLLVKLIPSWREIGNTAFDSILSARQFTLPWQYSTL